MGRDKIVLVLAVALAVSSTLAACGPATDAVARHLEQGNRLAEEGRYEQAIEKYDEVIRLNPESAEAYYNRGVTNTDLGQLQSAIEDYDEAIRLNPEFAEAHNNRGIAYRELGRKIEAVADLEKFITISNNPQLIDMAGKLIEELEG